MQEAWPQWRGPSRTGLVKWLPRTLSPEAKVVWEVPLGRAGLGGIAATKQYVFFGDRDLDDFQDVFCIAPVATDGISATAVRQCTLLHSEVQWSTTTHTKIDIAT